MAASEAGRPDRLNHRVALLAICAAIAVLVGLGLHRYLVGSFVAQSGSETATALELVDAFVATYAANRDALASPDAPVPATFRAHALARFAENRANGAGLRVRMVGMPGREIVTPPSDAQLIDTLRRLDDERESAPVSGLATVDGVRLLRTVLPSLASQQSCVDCHNALQPQDEWHRGDMMGAFVVDMPADAALAHFRRDAVLASIGTFAALWLIGRFAYRRVMRVQTLRTRLEGEARERIAGALECLPAGIALFDEHDRLFLANPTYRQMHRIIDDLLVAGTPFETILRENVRRGRFDLGPDEAEAYVKRRLEAHRNPGAPVERRLASGRWEQVREQRLAHGGIALVIIDITKEKEREAELQAALRKATDAVDQQRKFVAIVAHEFRTPLTIIDGAAQRLRRRAGDMPTDELCERVDKMRSGVERMSTLIDTILNSARADAGRIDLARVDLDLVSFVDALIHRFDTVASEFEIGFRSESPSLLVSADPRLLEQVVTNLLSNAIKYSGDSRRIDVRVATEGANAILEVRDYGVGIPTDEMPRMFTRFFRASTARGLPGTGIGLNLVRELVRLHGGEVGVDSRVGEGTAFTVRLPIAAGESAAKDATDGRARESA